MDAEYSSSDSQQDVGSEEIDSDQAYGSDDEFTMPDKMIKEKSALIRAALRGETGHSPAPAAEPISKKVRMETQLTMSDLLDASALNVSNKRILKKLPNAVPLERMARERSERKAAYQISQEDISKWQTIVKANREARTLEFSNRQADKLQGVLTTTSGVASVVKPETDMEREIAAMLNTNSNHKDDGEDSTMLPTNPLSEVDMKERQAKLSKMRSVLFYHEQKAKRFKAIKSKRHHKYLRKVEKRKLEKEGLALDPEEMKKEMEKAEYDRAQERLTLKHKNTSKWAKRALQRGFSRLDNDTKAALTEQLQISEALKRKVKHNYHSNSSSDESSSEDDDGDLNDNSVKLQNVDNKAKAEVLRLLKEDSTAEMPKKGLFSMPFMAKAIERQREEAKQLGEDFLFEIDNEIVGAKDNTDVDDSHNVPSVSNGVMTFGPKGTSKGPRNNEDSDNDIHGDETDEEALQEDSANVQQIKAPKSIEHKSKGTFRDGETLQREELGLPLPKPNAQKIVNTKTSSKATIVAKALDRKEEESNGPSTSEDEEGGDANAAHISQRGIIRKAFEAFGDDVQAEFDAEKEKDVEEELPDFSEPVDLPGWGKWQSDRKTPVWIQKARKKAQEQKEAALSSRKDKKLKHVVISEKYDKKAARYTADIIPYPFKSREDYERSIRAPIGKDFNSDKTFRDLTRPAVLTTTGVRIDPMHVSEIKKNKNNKISRNQIIKKA